jgi:hypothetical protein
MKNLCMFDDANRNPIGVDAGKGGVKYAAYVFN